MKNRIKFFVGISASITNLQCGVPPSRLTSWGPQMTSSLQDTQKKNFIFPIPFIFRIKTQLWFPNHRLTQMRFLRLLLIRAWYRWNGRRFFHIPYSQFSSILFPFHTKNLPFHFPFHTRIFFHIPFHTKIFFHIPFHTSIPKKF